MAHARTVGNPEAGPIDDPQTSSRSEDALPVDLDDLDRRLETAMLSLPYLHTTETCVWACACFLVDGSRE